MGVYIDGGDVDENEVFVRNVYPQIAIKRWWANNLGVYDESTATSENRGTFLCGVYKNDIGGYDYHRTWKEIRQHIEEEMLYQLSGDSQHKQPMVGMQPRQYPRAKKAPK